MISRVFAFYYHWPLFALFVLMSLSGCIHDPESLSVDSELPDDCSDALTYCEVESDDDQCFDLSTDPHHCGQCGNTCRAAMCDAGRCLPFDCDFGGQPFGGGDGSYSAPYTICSAQQLARIGDDDRYRGMHFALSADIDLSMLDDEESLSPIYNFYGSLDGFGFAIRNLNIDVEDNNVGLFTSLHILGEISNLELVDVSIDGGNHVGALVGHSHGTISNISADGIVSGHTWVGGLVGINRGQILDSATSIDVTTTGWGTGGLAGFNGGEILRSQSTGDIDGIYQAIGGLVGENQGHIIDSIAHPDGPGSVVGGEQSLFVGGLVGKNRSVITDCRAHGDVAAGAGLVGGLVGRSRNISRIEGSYATGDVSSPDRYVGGLVGQMLEFASVTDSYASGTVSSERAFVGGLVGEMSDDTRITDSYATGEVIGSIGNHVGGLVGNMALRSAVASSHSSADVTVSVDGDDHPFYTGGLVGRMQGQTIVADSHATGTIRSQAQRIGGIVGRIEENATIHHSWFGGHLENTGNRPGVGGLAGHQAGQSTISLSHATATVSAPEAEQVGGLVGILADNSVLTTSYATGDVIGHGVVGGLVGRSSENGQATNVYATGDVTASSGLAGGLYGRLQGDVRYGYAAGMVTTDDEQHRGGALVGDGDGNASGCYWDTDTAGIDDNGDQWGTGLSTEEFSDAANFPDWDFDVIWFISDVGTGNERPRFQWQQD